jgi:predicted aspartyl protease
VALQAIGPIGQGLLDGRNSPEIIGFELAIRIRPLERANPAVVEKVGIIDTGASHILIDRKAAKSLGLPARAKGTAEVASGEHLSATIYHGIVEAPDLGIALVTELYAFEEQLSSARVLIGRSFLRNFLVTFDGPPGIVTFARPSRYSPTVVEDE